MTRPRPLDVPAIVWAARCEDDAMLAQALATGDPVDATDGAGETALLHTALSKTMEATERLIRLLDAGANPNLANSRGWTPLLWASPYWPRVQALLAAGADPSVVGPGGMTVLMRSVAWSWVKDDRTFHHLLALGMDPGQRDDNGWDTLWWAAKIEHKRAVHVLMERGMPMDLHRRDREGHTILDICFDTIQPLLRQMGEQQLLDEYLPAGQVAGPAGKRI